MDSHLESTKPVSGNRRNGKMHKQLQTEYGLVEIETPRDRDGSFAHRNGEETPDDPCRGPFRQDHQLLRQRSEYAADQRLHRGELWQQALQGNHQQHHREGIGRNQVLAQPLPG